MNAGRWRRTAGWLGTILVLLVVSGLVLQTSAVPVMLDLRGFLLLASISAVLLLLAAWPLARTAARVATSVSILLLLVVTVVVIQDLLLSYRTTDVTIPSGTLTLHGTLYLPRHTGHHPGMVLVHGAGEESRDEYRYLARRYATRGVAALVYDKRGSGESEGDVHTATLEDLARDVVSAVGVLRAHPDVDGSKIGLWGLSEGEWVVPLAAQQAKPAFMVLVSAAAMSPSRQVQHETGANVLAAGFSADDAAKARALYAMVAQFERDGSNRDSLNRALQQASAEPWFHAAENLEARVPEYDQVLKLAWFPAWRARMDFDALPLLEQFVGPVLAIAGGSDRQNDGEAALQRIREAVERTSAGRFTGMFYPRAEHGIIEWRLPFRLPPPWYPNGYIEQQVQWVIDQVQMPRGGR